MIKVDKDYDAVPSALNRPKCKQKIQKAVIQKSGKVYDGYYYRMAYDALKRLYYGKCAYCESKIEHATSLQVEHYRPKNGVQEDVKHYGYYWLGCEWSNLLLACPNCNGKGAKGIKFPIEGIRVYDGSPFSDIKKLETFDRTKLKANQSPLKDEKPLLLNPEIDEPILHLTFNSDGQIEGITQKGKKSVKIYKLRRDLLYKERRKVRDEILEGIQAVILAIQLKKFKENSDAYQFFLKTAFDKLSKRKAATEEYALWGRYCYDNFEQCFIQKLDKAYQNGIRLAFINYKKSLKS